MKVKDITKILEDFAPLPLQEDYDNAGLLVGNPAGEVKGVLVTVDVTEEVISECMQKSANLVISHHPLIFSGLKKITGKNLTERIVITAIQNNIAIYAAHTNLDNVAKGINHKICEKLGLQHCRILSPKKNMLRKLVAYVPTAHLDQVRNAIFDAGAGHIGEYDQCSFNTEGKGTFRASERAHPFIGEKGKIHTEKETRLETIFPEYLERNIINALKSSHPYEEAAYDVYPLMNKFENAGAGMIGELKKPLNEQDFLKSVKEIFNCGCIKHSEFTGRPVQKIAVCGGSGSALLPAAIAHQADIFLTADIKYHQFFDTDNKILLADIGHYESEQFTKEVFYENLTKKIPNFAVYLTEIDTNPIKYL